MSRSGTGSIRKARPGEADTLSTLAKAAYAVYADRMDKTPGPALDDYAARIANGEAWILETPDGIAGLTVLIEFDDHLLLDNVAVAPGFQGRGVGKRLVAFAEAEAVARSYREIRLYTNVVMTENIPFYEALGWHVTGEGRQAGYDRIFMAKML